ncbi:MAG TPA: MMPL family transporter [Nannocystaceae bacterium]|nr:MMPL family transporter [Nannocystaceae bacterium]
MLAAIASAVARHARKLVIIALLAAVAAAFYGAGVARALSPGGFEVKGGEAQRVATLVADRFGHGSPDLVALVQREGFAASSPEVRARLQQIVDALGNDPAVASVDSPLGSAGTALVSKDGATAMLAISLRGDATAKEEAFGRLNEMLRSTAADVDVALGGPLAVAVVGQQTAEHDLVRAELVAFPLVAVLLLLFFGGRIATLLPLAVGGLSIAFATAVLRGLAAVADISVFALNIVTLLGLGLAIDYSLFLVQRFREELEYAPVHEAVVRTVTSAGKTTLFSGVAVAVSLLALLVFPIALLHSIAIAGAIIVTLTVIAALVVLPAMLAWLGPRVEWPRKRSQHAKLDPNRGWGRLAQWVMRRPGLVAIGTVILLLAVGAPTLRLDTALSDARIFPPTSEVRRVQLRIDEDTGFAAAGTVQYLLVLEGDADVWQPTQLGKLYDAHAALAEVEGVRKVDDLVTALGQDMRERFVMAGGFLADAPSRPPELAQIVDGNTTLVRVIADAPHDTKGRAEQVAAIRGALDDWNVSIGGAPQVAHEVDEALLRGAVPATIIVVVVTLVVLTLAFGAIVVAVKAVIMNVLSLSASFGALVWIFQDGRFEELLHYGSTGTIDPLILLVMFAIVFGLSMDYELFLLSRIREDYGETGDARESVARGLAATGRLITMAGLMLIVVLIGFGSAHILFVKQLGIGMAIAVAVDATIVRGLLVPATMRLLGRWNWWAAGWFARWWTRYNIGVRELPPGTAPTKS